MARKRDVRAVTVTQDSDGGCTVKDIRSGLVISIIGTHPDANGPIGITIEVYDYNGREVLMQDATQMKDSKGYDQPLRLTIARHPTVSFYPDNRSLVDLEDATPEQIAESQKWPEGQGLR